MAICYTDSLDRIDASMLNAFFEGWQVPPSPEEHMRILKGSQHVVLAVDDSCRRVIGFITAITDGCHSASIPLLEVLVAYRRQGIGRELVMRMLQALRDYRCIDLTCDPALQPFYETCGMLKSVGMAVRDYTRTGRE